MSVKGKNWILRSYKSGDESKINTLYNKVFQTGRSMADWKWKFDGSFINMTRLISVAEGKDGEIVGHYASLIRPWRFMGRFVLVGNPCDNYIDPDFKGGPLLQMRLFKMQVQYAADINVYFGYGFPNEAAYKVGKKLLKYKDIGDIPVMSLPLRLSTRLENAGRLGRLGGKMLRGIRFQSLSSEAAVGHPEKLPEGWSHFDRKTGLTFKVVERCGEKFDYFWKRTAPYFNIQEIKTSQFLNWRFLEKPGKLYSMISAERKSEIVGYSVIKSVTDSPGEVFMMDFLCEKDPDIQLALLRATAKAAKRTGAMKLVAWMHPSTLYYSSFLKAGFRNSGWSVKAVCFIFDHSPFNLDDLLDINNWYFTMGCTDNI